MIWLSMPLYGIWEQMLQTNFKKLGAGAPSGGQAKYPEAGSRKAPTVESSAERLPAYQNAGAFDRPASAGGPLSREIQNIL
jgi:hypothetical protein